MAQGILSNVISIKLQTSKSPISIMETSANLILTLFFLTVQYLNLMPILLGLGLKIALIFPPFISIFVDYSIVLGSMALQTSADHFLKI